MSTDTPRQRMRVAARAWVRALNAPGDADALASAITARCVVLRYVADEPDTPPERIAGVRTIGRWTALSPAKTRFSLVGPIAMSPDATRPVGTVGYRVRVGQFENFGAWTLTLAPDGRIRKVEHRPEPVPEKWRV